MMNKQNSPSLPAATTTARSRRLRRACILLCAPLLILSCNCIMVRSSSTVTEGHGRHRPRCKYRILVDKVMQPEQDWVTHEWMVKEAADAGFTVFCPRRGHERFDEVRQVAQWCEKYKMDYMPWMRGTLTTTEDDPAEGNKLVWASGVEQALWSPNADAFWDWTTKHVVEYAKISKEHPCLIGVFLDYENYAPGRSEGNAYSLSYDRSILSRFANSCKVVIPDMPTDQRKQWLVEHGLHEQFAAFQLAHWRKRCKTVRAAVDEHNPRFRFCVYPAPGTDFITHAIYQEWATPTAPLLLADASTYGRSSSRSPFQQALDKNQQKLLKRMQIPKSAGIPFSYIGGIDPVVRGADPIFSGSNAVAISGVTDGYWLFYEGPTYTAKDHARYWKAFAEANRIIAERDAANRAP
jgi:hypothetical protein